MLPRLVFPNGVCSCHDGESILIGQTWLCRILRYWHSGAKRGALEVFADDLPGYATALFGHLAADAVTLSPYLGEDAIEPFLEHEDRVVYVLARTSNASAGTIQNLPVDGAMLHERVARWVAERWPGGRVGLVVGATRPDDLRRLRELVPAPGFLVPGVGAQGGELEAAVACCHGTDAPGLVNVSRAISKASSGDDWQEAAGAAAAALQARMKELGATLGR